MSSEMTVEQAVELVTGTIQRKTEEIKALKQELAETQEVRDFYLRGRDHAEKLLKEEREKTSREQFEYAMRVRAERDAATEALDRIKVELRNRPGATWLDILNENAAMRDRLATIKEAFEK